ncbi:MAG: hypothetical protein WA005_05250 [Candidatus Binataceae bacterium]
MKRGARTIALLLIVAELFALRLVSIPSFNFAFNDEGSNLTAQYLMSRGLVPLIDFGYLYGLLPLLIGKLWFCLFGLTARAYGFAALACSLLVGFALWRASVSLGFGLIAQAFIVITIGWAVGSYPNFAHALEAVLICNALAEQAAGRFSSALALTLMAALAKPSMGYVYFAVLLAVLVFTAARDGESEAVVRRIVVRTVAPALALFGVAVLSLSAWFGLRATLLSLTPLAGMQVYRTLGYGFFHGAGHSFWHPAGVRWGYYFGTVAGFWLLGTVVLIGFGVLTAFSGHLESRRAQITLTCAILQVLFILFFFGGGFSWFYYPYMLTLGLAAGANDLTWAGRLALALLAGLSILAWKATATGMLQEWRNTTPRRSMAELWASSEEAREWQHALQSAQSHSATVLSALGCANLISDEFEKPVALYLIPGHATKSEIQREVTLLDHVSIVVIPEMPGWGGIPEIPAIKDTMRQRFEVAWRGDFFAVYRSVTVSLGQLRGGRPQTYYGIYGNTAQRR